MQQLDLPQQSQPSLYRDRFLHLLNLLKIFPAIFISSKLCYDRFSSGVHLFAGTEMLSNRVLYDSTSLFCIKKPILLQNRNGFVLILTVTLINQTISITKTYYNPTNNTLEYQLVTPKTRKSRRKMVVAEEVINAMKEYKKEQAQVIERLGADYYNKDFIFAKMERQYGYSIVIKTVQNRMARLLRIASLNSELTPHSLRLYAYIASSGG